MKKFISIAILSGISSLATSTAQAADTPKGILTAAIWPLNHKKTMAKIAVYPVVHPIKTLKHIPPFGF